MVKPVAIFPLPNFVAFPGQVHYFHIFEPRYRKLIQDCLDNRWEIGVALAERPLSEEKHVPPDKELTTNQTTYEPAAVYGAGPVKLMKTLEDGRLLVQVRICRRVRTLKILQSVPYYLAKVQPLKEKACDDGKAREQYEKIYEYSMSILKEHGEAFDASLPAWGTWNAKLRNLLAVFLQWVRVDAGICQQLLEEDNLGIRAQFLTAILRSCVREREKNRPPPERRPVERKGNVLHVDFASP